MNTISTINIKDLNIVELQKDLKNKEMTILDFVGDVELVVANDNVYIKRKETWSPDVGSLKIWREIFFDNFEIQNYLTVEYDESDQIENVLLEIFAKCKIVKQTWPISGYYNK